MKKSLFLLILCCQLLVTLSSKADNKKTFITQFSFNCPPTGLANITAFAQGQASTYNVIIPIIVTQAGSATFNMSSMTTNLSLAGGSFISNLTVGQTSVSIPVVYSGIGSTSGLISFSSLQANSGGSCSASVINQLLFTFNCLSISPNPITGFQEGTASTVNVTIPISNAHAGAATINVTGGHVSGTLNTTLNNGQTSIIVPVNYDGEGVGGETILIQYQCPQIDNLCSGTYTIGVAPLGKVTFNYDLNGGLMKDRPATLDPSAILKVQSTKRGILIPQMTTAQKNAIASPANGLLVYDTDLQQFSYRIASIGGGTATIAYWQNFGTPTPPPPSVWNTNVNDISNTNSGNVGIGTTSNPSAKLEIQADAVDGLKVTQTNYNNGILINSTTGNNKAGLKVNNQGSGHSGFFSSDGTANGFRSEIINPSSNWNAIEGQTLGTGIAGNFNSALGIAGQFNSVSGKAILVLNGNVGFGSYNSPNKLSVGGSADFTGKVGIGVETLGKAQLEIATNIKTTALLGSTSTGISLQQNWPTIGFNQYRDGNNLQRYIGTGYAMGNFMNPTNGNMYWVTNATGTAGAITSEETVLMNLTKEGKLGIGTSITPNSTLLTLKGSNFDGSAVFGGTNHNSHFHYSTTEDTYIRGGKDGSNVIINDGALGKVGIGIYPTTYKLEVNGTARAKEVIVETVWADYVFDENYKLRSIDEMEDFIKENKHLPNIPKASEIEKNGLKLGETNKAMMEKIEELALYIIQLKKEIDILKSKN